MLKEKVAENLREQIRCVIVDKKNWHKHKATYGGVTVDEEFISDAKVAGQILNLFKTEVDKLTVIDGEEIDTTEINHLIGSSMVDGGDWVMRFAKSLIKQERATQLQHTKKQLLEKME